MPHRKFRDNRTAYAIHRAGVALDRLVAATTPAAKRQATRWAMAWFVAGGMHPPASFKLKV